MKNVILIAIMLLIIGLAGRYVYKAKKSGKKCIGCPESCSCGTKETGGCSCGCQDEK